MIDQEEFQKILEEAIKKAYLRGFSDALQLASDTFAGIINDLKITKTEAALRTALKEVGDEV